MVAKVRGSGERFWSTLGSGLAHTASHSAVWIDFALAAAGESATATTSSIRSLGVTVLPTWVRDSTPRRAPSIPSSIRARYLLGGVPIPEMQDRAGTGHGDQCSAVPRPRLATAA